VDPTQCREKLGRLMTDETAALRELAGMLDQEYGFLEKNDVVSLEGAIRERQRCVARIYRIDEQRRALCQERGVSLDHLGLEALLRWCDPGNTLAAGWADCTAAATVCRQLNDRNGALVAARLQHVQARLGTLISTQRASVTYGPRGVYAPAASGRVLATEA